MIVPHDTEKAVRIVALARSRGVPIIAYDRMIPNSEIDFFVGRFANIPDDPKLFDALTVAEHLEFIAVAYGVTGWSEKVARLLEQFRNPIPAPVVAAE